MNEEYIKTLKSDEQEYDVYIILEDGTKVDTDISAFKIIYNLGQKLIGNFITKKVEFNLFNTNKYDITDKEFEVFVGLKINDNFVYNSIGKYICEKPVKESKLNDEYKISATNYSLKFKQKYVQGTIKFPCTITQAINYIATYLNIEYVEEEFINNEYLLQEFFIDEDATFFDVIKTLVEAAFANADINMKNQLTVKNPSMNVEYTFDLNELFEIDREDNMFGALNSIVASRIVADDGSTTEDVYSRNEESITQNGLYEYKIIQNDAIDYDRKTAIDNILSKMLNFKYTPAKIEAVYNPFIDVGKMLEVPYESTSFLLFVKEVNIDLATGLMLIESTEDTKTETDYKSATNKEKRRKTEIKVNKLEGKIEQIVEEQSDYKSKLSKVEQDVDSINQKVSTALDFEREVLNSGIVFLENCGDGTGYIEEVSIRDITYLTPSETLTPSEYLVPFGDYFTLVVDKAPKTQKTSGAIEYKINLKESLKRIDLNVYDEVSIKNNQIQVIRRVGKNEDGNLYQLENDIVEDLGSITISTFDPDTYIYIKETSNVNIYAKYMVKNNFDEKYATKIELSSSISQSAEEIMLEVNKKVDENEFGTKIQQNSEAVKIAWNQISEYIQAMILNGNASLAILDKNKKVMMSLDKTGQHFLKEDGSTVFGEMGVQKENNNQYIAFSVLADYGKTTSDGMAWGVKTKSDNKFYPILYIKEFAMGNKNAGAGYGQLILSACDILLNGVSTGIISGNVKMYGDVDGIVFKSIDTNKILFKVSDSDMNTGLPRISVLDDKIAFYNSQAGGCTLRVGDEYGNYVAVTDDGNVLATGVFLDNQSLSDKRLKKNIKNTKIKALDIINKIKHREFFWKKDNKYVDIGYIAQEMKKIDPNFVIESKRDKTLHMNLLPILATATKSIQELSQKVEEQENIIELLKNKIEKLEEKING